MADLRCPFCSALVRDEDFKTHIIQYHAEVQGRVRGSYVLWLEGLRVGAGGDWRLGAGQGDGAGVTRR